jgi:DNA processing protein
MPTKDRGGNAAPKANDPDGPKKPERLRSWLALLYTPGLGSRRINRLLTQVEDPADLFCADHPLHAKLEQRSRAHLRNPDWRPVDDTLAWLEGRQRHILTLSDPAYPQSLREIGDPPPLLFVQGDPDLLHAPQVALVGSRNPSASGRQTATDFARSLVNAGLTITSGLATGIDGAAHQGALAGGGRTIAVMGTGLDRVYPARHRELAHQIAEQGTLVSELAPGTPPVPGNFPRRNRIISGLSLGTLVVEAAQQSGSLITARLAGEQGREVFAIPGSIHNPLARGCHALIRQGAKLVETAGDILEELAPLLSALEPVADAAPPPTQELRFSRDPDYQQLMSCLGFDPVAVDQLIQQSGLTAEAVSSMLLLLELDGLVESAVGGRYCLTGKTTP